MKKRADRQSNILHADQSSKEFQLSLIQALANAIPGGILAVDQNDTIVATNKRLFELWDIDPENIDEARIHTLIGVKDTVLLERALEQVKHPDAFQERVRELYANPDADDHAEIELRNGTVLECHSTVLRDHNHDYLGRVWFFNDLTAYKKTEEKLANHVLSDSLTGLANHNHFTIRADEEFARARRYGHPLSIIMLDIDHFKNVNDKHGNDVGDQVLVALAAHCTELLRKSDFTSRTGGEEFMILMPVTRLDEAAASAERLRQHVAVHSITTDAGKLTITVSLGVASLRSEDSTLDHLLKRADEALYLAKNAGRNRIHKLE